jgi:hypothetical protein
MLCSAPSSHEQGPYLLRPRPSRKSLGLELLGCDLADDPADIALVCLRHCHPASSRHKVYSTILYDSPDIPFGSFHSHLSLALGRACGQSRVN